MPNEPAVRLKDLATEQRNPRARGLEHLPTRRLLEIINAEDRGVPEAVARAIPRIETAVEGIVARLRNGGRLFYIGAGTSGRLGCVDASEMPPTFGVDASLVQGIIAGGPPALTASQEGAEDDGAAGVRDLEARGITERDAVVGLSASGRAAYVREALRHARARGLFTACITCNVNSPLIPCAEAPIVVETGPEVVAGSTRMKAGTAQKLVLNMISTSTMIRLGRVADHGMVDLQVKCEKLRERARDLVMDATGASAAEAEAALRRNADHARRAIDDLRRGMPAAGD